MRMLRIFAPDTIHVSYITKSRSRRRNRSKQPRASYDKHEQFRLHESCIGRNGNVGRAYTYNATLYDTIHPWAVISLLLLAPFQTTNSSIPVDKFFFAYLVLVIQGRLTGKCQSGLRNTIIFIQYSGLHYVKNPYSNNPYIVQSSFVMASDFCDMPRSEKVRTSKALMTLMRLLL